MPKPNGRRGRFERFLFSFMGPPQLGDASEPAPPVERAPMLCPTCGRLYEDHDVVRTPSLTYTRCPDQAAQ